MEITQSKNNTPQLSLKIKASINSVWDAIRNKEKLLQWHGWDGATLKDEIENIYFTDVKEEIKDDRHILVVNGGDTFIVEPAEDATRLTLLRTGLSGDPAWDEHYDNITEGWVSFIEQLRFMLEYPFSAPRKTTFNTLTLNRDKVIADLGVIEEKEGAKFSGVFQDEEIAGAVWFSTSNQLGLVIDTWGPGLLIFQFSENSYIATHLN
jgi:hypothetical protein